MQTPSSLFISHGSPDLVLHDTDAKHFLENAGSSFDRPKGIVIASAHFETRVPTVVSDPNPEMIYDFGNFDNRLNEIVYPAPGSADLANRVSTVMKAGGVDLKVEQKRGFDHGTWVPLMLLYQEADIPVVQISIQPDQSPKHHFELGAALTPLTEDGILVIGSGSLTHNLGALFGPKGFMYDRKDKEVEWARSFADWINAKIDEGDVDRLLDYRDQAPFAVENHPTDEHLLPLFVALGASHTGSGERLHRSTEFAILAMDAFAFN